MRTLFLSAGLAALLLGGAGCAGSVSNSNAPSSNAPSADTVFGPPVTFAIGQSVTFQNGMSLQLKVINDSRCPADVQCIWAGELSPVFVLHDVDKTSQEFTLGTVRTTQATVKKYTITLNSATVDQATVTVSASKK